MAGMMRWVSLVGAASVLSGCASINLPWFGNDEAAPADVSVDLPLEASEPAAAPRPFEPSLTLNNASEYCAPLLSAARQAFRTEAQPALPEGGLGTLSPIAFTPLELGADNFEASIAPALIGESDTPMVLLRVQESIGWRGDVTRHFLAADADAARTGALALRETGLFDGQSPLPDALVAISDVVWNSAEAYLSPTPGGALYIKRAASAWPEPLPTRWEIARIGLNGAQPVCTAEVLPDRDTQLASLPAPVRDWLADYDPVRGQMSASAGTAGPMFWGGADKAYDHARLDLSTRPWMGGRELDLSVDRLEARAALELTLWGSSDPVSWRNAGRVQDGRAAAETALAAHYAEQFDMSPAEAARAAETGLAWLHQAAFYARSNDAFKDEILARGGAEAWARTGLNDGDSDYVQFRLALLLDVPLDALTPTLAALAEDPRKLDLALAIHRPDALSVMITAGADVNQTNEFGKTPLMYAAHLNAVDAARILLAAGADVGARTLPEYEQSNYDYLARSTFLYDSASSVRITERTALMYALENAGPTLVSLLLAAGADAAATDSEGRTMTDYLALNTGLTTAQRTEMEALLRAAQAGR